MRVYSFLLPLLFMSATHLFAQDASVASLSHASSYVLSVNPVYSKAELPTKKIKKLVSFDVSTDNCNGLLSWETISGQNVEFFIVEKSTNANTFTEIGRVYAANSLSTYSFVDRTFTEGSFYRIKVVDPTKDHFHSQIHIANCKCSTIGNWLVYPNPIVGDQLSIAYEHILPGAHDVQVQILDEEGNVIVHEAKKVNSASDQIKIDLNEIPEGTYHIEMFQNHMPLGGQLFVKASQKVAKD